MFKNIKKVIQKIQTASVSEIFNSTKDGNLEDLKNALSETELVENNVCLLYTSPSPRDRQKSRMPSSA